MSELIKTLNLLWAGTIKRIEFILLKHSILLEIEVVENESVFNFEVIFEGVSSYFYSNNEGDERLQIDSYDEGDYLELTSMHYIEEGIGDISIKSQRESWTKNWYASANFVLEIWSSYLFIEAKSLSVNGTKFQVGYPINK
jgi:hypothetical protein